MRHDRILRAAAAVLVLAAARPAPGPRELVRAAARAMGGEEALRGLRAIRLDGFEEERLVGIAERPDRARTLLRTFSELRDVPGGRARISARLRLVMRPDPIPGTRVVPARGGTVEERERLDLAPERILLDALDAPDLVALPDTTIDGRPARVVRFGADPAVRLYLDAATDLPLGWSAVRTYPDDPFVWSAWGDVTTVVRWGSWSLEPGGIRYPRERWLARNGIPYRNTTITGLDLAAAAAPDSFAAPAGPPRSAAPPDTARAVDDGIAFLPGGFDVLLVRQEDGVVAVEAPGSAARSRAALAEAARRFPGVPVRAVVATSYPWPHLAGVREYVARGIPVYAPRAAGGAIRALVAAPHTLRPDSLARAPAPLDLRVVDGRETLGSGRDRIVLIAPAGAAGGALVAWLPGPRLLYAGDLWIPERFEPNLWRESRRALEEFVAGAGLPVRTVTGLHLEPTPWRERE